MLLIIMIYGFNIFQINSKACEIQQMQPIITCYQLVSDCFILEGIEEDYYKLKNVEIEIVQKLFTIPFKVVPIKTKILQSLGQVIIQQKLICQLFLDFNYYIICNKFDSLNYEKYENELESITININITFEESCDEFYQLDSSNFILFCMTQFTLRQYQVSLEGDIILLFEYDVSIQIQDKCKKKQFKLLEKNQFIIAFFNCYQWKILYLRNEQTKIIVESKINENNHAIQIFTKIDHVQICQLNSLTLYLIDGNNYGYLIRFHYIYKSFGNTLTHLLSKICQQIILITQNNGTISQSVKKLNNEIVLDHSFNNVQVHFFSNVLFMQNQTELNVRIDEHLILKYEILNSSLIFIEQDNLFYQIDKYSPISGYLQPKQQFVYLLQRLDSDGEQSLLKCFRMQYEDKVEENNIQQYSVLIKKNCQDKQSVKHKIPIFTSFLQQEFEFHNNKTGNVKLNIYKKEELEYQCYQRLKRYNFKNKITLQSIKNRNYIVFQDENTIYFLNCQQNKIQMNININQFEVLEYLQDYCLIDKNNMKIKMIQFISGQIILSQIISNIKIITTQYTSEQIIIYVKNSETTQILYYKELRYYKFIQYQDIFAFELNGEVKYFKLQGVQIISIKNWLKSIFYIWGVHNQTNSIILYHLEEYELHQIINNTLQEYQFSNPLKYRLDIKRVYTHTFLKLAILIEKNESHFIATYSFSVTTIKLVNIIPINDTYFEFINDTLLYLNNGQIWHLYLDEIVSLIQLNISSQKTLYQQYQLTLNPTQVFEDSINLNIHIFNECYILSSQLNQSSFKISMNENLKIKISEIFLGQIHNISIKDKYNIKLKGPLQFTQQIKDCVDTLKFCIKQKTIHFLNQYTQALYLFSVIILEDKILCEFMSPTNEKEMQQVFWISENIFLWIYQFNDYLHIHLLQCILEDDQNCMELQLQIINFTVGLPINENVFKTQIKLQNVFQQTYIFIQNTNFSLIHLPSNNNLDIKYIEQSEAQFVGSQRLDYKQKFKGELTIYSINQTGIYIKFSLNISKILSNLLPKQESNAILKNIVLIQCKLNVNITSILLF